MGGGRKTVVSRSGSIETEGFQGVQSNVEGQREIPSIAHRKIYVNIYVNRAMYNYKNLVRNLINIKG